MGNAAHTGRRTLLAHVKECIALANGVSADLGVIREKHDAFVDLVKTDVAGVERRCQAYAVTKAQAAIDEAKRVERSQKTYTDTLRAEAGPVLVRLQQRRRLEALDTFLRRLRWLFTGHVPETGSVPGDGGVVRIDL